jgi:predicted Zn-dependent peptidase
MHKLLGIIVFVSLIILPSCQTGGPPEAGATPLPFGKSELDNGLEIVIVERPEAPIVTIAARCDAGILRELAGEAGYAPLLAQLIKAEAESGCTGGFTDLGSELLIDLKPDHLFIGVTVLAEDAPAASERLFSVFAQEFTDERILKQRDILVGRLSAALGTVTAETWDKIFAALYPDLPYGDLLQEKIDSLKELTPEKFRVFSSRCMGPRGAVAVAAGRIDEGLRSRLHELATGWRDQGRDVEKTPTESERRSVTGLQIVPAQGKQAGLFLVRRLPALDPKSYYQAFAVNFILNGRTTGGLIADARLGRLQYAIGLEEAPVSSLQMMRGGSSQTIQASGPAAKAGEIGASLMRELEILYGSLTGGAGILDQEISDAKNNLQGQLLRATETTRQQAEFILWSEWYGFAGYDRDAHLRLIQKIDKDAVLEAIRRDFEPALHALIAVGPERTLQSQLANR